LADLIAFFVFKVSLDFTTTFLPFDSLVVFFAFLETFFPLVVFFTFLETFFPLVVFFDFLETFFPLVVLEDYQGKEGFQKGKEDY